MTQTASADFIQWLNSKLRELNTDESVFGSYIVGILEEESESAEEKTDALEGILSEILESNINEIITEILNKWEEYHSKEIVSSKNATPIDVNEQLARLLEAQKLPTIKEREYSEEERKIREQILAQYSQTEIAEEEEYEGSDDETAKQNSAKASSSSGLERNTNAHDVMQMQKEKREQARQDSAAKKQKDKDDREKQRQLREEKKEKRKTVKGERRR